MMAKITQQQLAQHGDIPSSSSGQNGKQDEDKRAWTAVNGKVWDVTDFAPQHPGGLEVMAEYFGRDASRAYNEVHGPGLVGETLGPEKLVGEFDGPSPSSEGEGRKMKEKISNEKQQQQQQQQGENNGLSILETDEDAPLDAILNMHDFEIAAKSKFLSTKTYAFYSAAANDSLSLRDSLDVYSKIWFRPRVLAGVANVDTSRSILGNRFSVPFFSAPAALAKLSHPDGEQAIARGLAAHGSTIVACHNASFSLAEIASALPKDYPLFFQLYINKDRSKTEKLILEQVNKIRPKAILVTVDLPVVGKREADERVKIESNFHAQKHAALQQGQNQNSQADRTVKKKDKKGAGLARTTGSFIDPDFKWSDIAWLKSLTDIPIFLKGIQGAADARKALERGCSGIYLSNHGGRAVDTAQPSLLTLLEIQANCPDILEKMEVFIDGGIRRGTDILKAICLGASGVCLGRSFLYAVVYGQEGVEHAIEILRDELETAMQMVGITSLVQAHPGLLNTSRLDPYVYRGDGHPWARKIVRRSSSARESKL